MQELIAGRYRIIEKIGEGGMGEVYSAMDERLQRQVALKRLHILGGSESKLETFKARFQREAVSMARFSHASIVPVYDYGDDEDGIFLVMGFMPGGSLEDRMGYPVDPKTAIQYLLPVAEALAFIHKHDLIHRDVKPQNVLFNEHGGPMLADFGIVKLMSEDADRITTTGTAGMGTPAYMAPEQISTHFDHRVDQYALGIILYELLTGRVPFKGDTPVMTLLLHSTETLTDPRIFVPELPDEVVALASKALAKQPDDRYADMKAFRAAMKNVWQALPNSVDPVYQPDEEIPAVQAVPTLVSEAKGTVVGIPKAIRTKKTRTNPEKPPGRNLPVWLWLTIAFALVSLIIVGILLGKSWFGGTQSAALDTRTPLPTPVIETPAPAMNIDMEEVSLSFSGLTALQLLTERMVPEFAENHPNWQFDIVGGGSSSGILGAGRNTVDFGMARRVLSEGDWARFPRLKPIPVALDAVYVINHPDNPVTNLSLKQLKAVLNGEINNWSALGGADTPIEVMLGPLDADTKSMLEMLVADDLTLDKLPIAKESEAAVYDAVLLQPGALGIVFAPPPREAAIHAMSVNGAVPDEENIRSRAYPLVIELVYITNGEASVQEQTWLDFVFSPEGKRLMREAGFIPAE